MPDDSQTPASPYAGRWVARLRGKIVAQGGTPEQALHAAQKSRHKEKPEIIYMPAHYSHSPLIDKVRDSSSGSGYLSRRRRGAGYAAEAPLA